MIFIEYKIRNVSYIFFTIIIKLILIELLLDKK